MSKLERLISELCPDGVEYVELGEVAEVLRGKRLTKNQLLSNEQYPVFHGGLEPLGYYTHHNRKADTVMVINVGASAGTVGYSSVDFWSSDGCFCIGHSDLFISRFIYYALLCQEDLLRSKVRFAGIPTLDRTVVESIKIPLPPLPVQQEIVRILDTFLELNKELNAELAARRKQYKYYRDLLLEFNEDVGWARIADIAEIGTGSSNRVNAVDNGEYPFYVRSETILRSNRYLFDEEAIIIPGEGGIGEVFHYVNGKYDLHQRAYRIHFKGKKVLTKFAYYYFEANFKKFIMMKAVIATVTSIRKPMIEDFKIPIPPLSVQQDTVRILDTFTELAKELSNEIEARQKQYEYYLNKLLDFKEVVS